MTLSQFADIADLLTALAVLVSLIFVLIELRRSNAETKLANSLHLTEIVTSVRAITDSPDMADIVMRGRAGMEHLTPAERMVYQKFLLRVLHAANTVRRVSTLSIEGERENHGVAIRQLRAEWDHPGPRDWWRETRANAPVVASAATLADEALDTEAMP